MYEEWLALAIDTEGWISIGCQNDIGIGFSNSSEELATAFMQRAEALNCRTSTGYYLMESGKTMYFVRIAGTRDDPGTEDELRFLKAICPYLLGRNVKDEPKKELAERAIVILENKIQYKYKRNPLNFMETGKWYSVSEIESLMQADFYVRPRLYTLREKGLVEERKMKSKRYVEWRKRTEQNEA